MRELFGCEVGLSDHTMGVGVAVAAVAHGASVIEKHLTLRRADGGVDSAFSMEPEEMSTLVTETERAWQALGKVSYGPTEAEKNLYFSVARFTLPKTSRQGIPLREITCAQYDPTTVCRLSIMTASLGNE